MCRQKIEYWQYCGCLRKDLGVKRCWKKILLRRCPGLKIEKHLNGDCNRACSCPTSRAYMQAWKEHAEKMRKRSKFAR
jgi:hypothetical protein